MPIPSHHIHNVLTAYSHRLNREISAVGDEPADEVFVSLHKKRQTVLEKVLVEMADRLIRFGIDTPKKVRPGGRSPADPEKNDPAEKPGEKSLIYNVIDKNDMKSTREISSADFSSLFGATRLPDAPGKEDN